MESKNNWIECSRSLRESIEGDAGSTSHSSGIADPSQEDVGDIDAVSNIMNLIYNWWGSPPMPASNRRVPIISSPGSVE